MPFVTFSRNDQSLEIDSPFAAGSLCYQKLEGGIYIMYSRLKYMANVRLRLLYDELPSASYYVLGYHISENNFVSRISTINDISLASKCWTLFKPGTRTYESYPEGTISEQVTIYFDGLWLNKNLLDYKCFNESGLSNFFNITSPNLYWADTGSDIERNFKSIVNTFIQKKSDGLSHLLQLKMLSFEFILYFTKNYSSQQKIVSPIVKRNVCQEKTLKIEKYLHTRLSAKFEGIESIAIKFNISPSKLKSDFKSIFGKTVFQYFRECQMLLARELLKNEDVRIKELSYSFGYENPGKFSAAFKKHFKQLPSEQPRNG